MDPHEKPFIYYLKHGWNIKAKDKRIAENEQLCDESWKANVDFMDLWKSTMLHKLL